MANRAILAAMSGFDVEGFVASLRARGLSEAHLPTYLELIRVLAPGGGAVTPASVEEAVARETAAGADARRVASLRKLGQAMVAFAAGAPLPVRGAASTAPPSPAPPSPGGSPPRVAPVAAAVLELATAPRRPAAAVDAAPSPFGEPPRAGCICRERKDVYLADLWQGVGNVFLGVTGFATVAVWRLAPRFVYLVVATGFLGVGALITALTVGYRCEHCRRWIAGKALDADERAEVRKRGLIFLGIAVALLIACAATVATVRSQWRKASSPAPALEPW